MKFAEYTSSIQNHSKTRTIQDFGKLLGEKPHKFGQLVELYPDLTITSLTDALGNVWKKPKEKFTNVKSMVVEWGIKVNYIKKVHISRTSTTDGQNATDVVVIMKEKYFDKNDVFILENRQRLIVITAPKKISQHEWQYTCRLLTSDLNVKVDLNYLQKGKFTRYETNYFPELSNYGFIKYTSNTELHRNYMSRHRHGVTCSGDYAAHEMHYIEDLDKDGKVNYFQLNPKEEECLQQYMLTREQHCLFGESNFDSNGKCLVQDAEGRDLPSGDGVVTQFARFCDKFPFNRLTLKHFKDMMSAMRAKSDKPIGNTYTLMVNERMWDSVQDVLAEDTKSFTQLDGAWYYSMKKAEKEFNGAGGNSVKLGSTFTSYSYGGNTINFIVDRALSKRWHDRGYGVFLDNTPVKGMPNIIMCTLEGREMISGTLHGMGGANGRTSGVISTPVDGTEYHLLGYSCPIVFNPYKAIIAQEAITY